MKTTESLEQGKRGSVTALTRLTLSIFAKTLFSAFWMGLHDTIKKINQEMKANQNKVINTDFLFMGLVLKGSISTTLVITVL
jgi:hypothetical protein